MEILASIEKYIHPDVIASYSIAYGTKLLGAIAIFVIGKWLARNVSNFAEKIMLKGEMDETIVSFLGNILYGALFAFVIIAVLSQLGIETTSLAAILAAAGLAIGMALQGSLGNLASGVMIIAFRPFKNGDFIEAGGESGSVDEVSIFTTTLKTGDNKTIIIPNGKITSDNIINYSTQKTRRIDFVFGCGYNDDLKKVKAVLEDIIAKDERILKDPEPLIAVGELADSSVNFKVRPWVKSSDYWNVYHDITETVKLRFDEEGISIPFPQQDVYMHQVKG